MARIYSNWDPKGLFRGANSEKQYLLVILDNRLGGFRVRPLSARLTREELAKHLNTTKEGISHLVSEGLLTPLTDPDLEKQMYFPTQYTLDLLDDPVLLAKITECLQKAVTKKFNKAKKAKACKADVERPGATAKP